MNLKNHNIFDNCKWLIASVLLACAIVSGCSKSSCHKNIKEGSIKYKITYLSSEKENPIIGLLPSNITMKFKDDNVLLELEGWLGIFKSSFIKDNDQNAYTLLKILNKKFLYISTAGEGFYGMEKPDNMQIEFDDITKDIIGFNCKHAIVTIPDICEFDVFYTTDIKIKNATANTPLNKIPGMLMEFRLNMNGIPMQVEATDYYDEKVPNTAFEIPDGYERVRRSQMDSIFNAIGQKH